MNSTRRFWFLVCFSLFGVIAALNGQTPVKSDPLQLGAGDVGVEARQDGYHLFVKAKPGVGSVLLTEAFEAPDHKLASYALRSPGANPVNDGEKRLLDGKFLPQPHHSLLSSTPKSVA